MRVHINLAVLLSQWVQRHNLNGPVATLGVQHLSFSGAELERVLGRSDKWGPASPAPLPAADFFSGLGLGRTVSVDVSDYEGANVLFDLNTESPPLELLQAFGVVFNGGTLEHVFHVPNALANITTMLSERGVVIHVLPLNNWVDHGFFQFSPTLMFDYYAAAGFDALESVVVAFEPRRQGGAAWEVCASPPGLFGQGSAGTLDDRTYLHLFLARRTEHTVARPIPTQALYARSRTRPIRTRWFSTFELHSGTRVDHPNRFIVPFRAFIKDGDFAWRVPLPELAPWADSAENPAKSRLVILEDEMPLGPAHAPHETLRNNGAGAYSHWGEQVLISTPDNSDPNTNGRTYIAVLPGRSTI